MNFTIGCDPELFLLNPEVRKLISAVGLIGGTKQAPKPIGEGCAVQEDNVAVEFCTPPATSLEEFKASIDYNLEYIRAEASKLGLELAIVPSGVFDDDQLNTPAAKEFGCEPDYNAWTREINPRPSAPNKNLRSAGGHIHIGVDGLDPEQLVRAMDAFVGAELLEYDEDKDRRQLYGKAGAFRFKPYGVEYRTASNAWIKSPELIEFAYNQTKKAVEFVASGKVQIPDDGIGKVIQNCINNSDKSLLPQIREFVNQ